MAAPRPSSFIKAKRFLARTTELHAQLPDALQFFLEMALAAVGLVVLWALGGLVGLLRGHLSDLFVDALSIVKEFAVLAIVCTETVRGLERFKVLNEWPRRALKVALSGVAVVGILAFFTLATEYAADGAGSRLRVLPPLLRALGTMVASLPAKPAVAVGEPMNATQPLRDVMTRDRACVPAATSHSKAKRSTTHRHSPRRIGTAPAAAQPPAGVGGQCKRRCRCP